MTIIHHPHCCADYPEKPADEPAQFIVHEQLDAQYWVKTCSDCGAFDTNLPSQDDPYWDDARAELAQPQRRR